MSKYRAEAPEKHHARKKARNYRPHIQREMLSEMKMLKQDMNYDDEHASKYERYLVHENRTDDESSINLGLSHMLPLLPSIGHESQPSDNAFASVADQAILTALGISRGQNEPREFHPTLAPSSIAEDGALLLDDEASWRPVLLNLSAALSIRQVQPSSSILGAEFQSVSTQDLIGSRRLMSGNFVAYNPALFLVDPEKVLPTLREHHFKCSFEPNLLASEPIRTPIPEARPSPGEEYGFLNPPWAGNQAYHHMDTGHQTTSEEVSTPFKEEEYNSNRFSVISFDSSNDDPSFAVPDVRPRSRFFEPDVIPRMRPAGWLPGERVPSPLESTFSNATLNECQSRQLGHQVVKNATVEDARYTYTPCRPGANDTSPHKDIFRTASPRLSKVCTAT